MKFKKYAFIVFISVVFSLVGFIAVSKLVSSEKDAVEIDGEGAPTEPKKAFNAKSFELQNGMRVVLIENHRAPIVSHMLWYNVGAMDEPFGKSGIAHFFEHLMFKGTQTMEPGEYSRRIRALGGQENAFTGQDFTAYFVNIAVENLPEIMRMEADRMVNLSIPEAHFLSERNVILEERAQRTDTKPAAQLSEAMRASLFPNHPYGIPIIGWREEIETLDYQSAMDFYTHWYAPNNAILVVSGAISREELEPLAQEIYGRIPAKEVKERYTFGAPILPGDKSITYEHEHVKQESFSRMCRMPSYSSDKSKALAIDIMANILDGGAATRLYKSVVSEQKLASNVSLGYSGFARRESVMYVSAKPNEGVSLKELEQAIDAVLFDLGTNPPGTSEVGEAKKRLINNAIYARDSLQGPAYIFGQALSTGLSIDDIEYWTADIESISDQDVRDVIPYFIQEDRCVSGFLKPKSVTVSEEN